MAVMPLMDILIILLLQLPEDIIVVAEPGILSNKDVLTALVRADSHGMDQNAHHSPRPTIQVIQVTQEEEAIIILPQAHTSTVALRAIIGMAVNV